MLDKSSLPVGDGACASPAPGNEFNTSHPTMLLQIKGEEGGREGGRECGTHFRLSSLVPRPSL